MTAPFSFAAFQAQQAQNPPVGLRRSPLSFASFQAQQEEEEERIRAERGARDGVLPAVVTTAQAPKPFERALARGVMASGTTDPAFGRESDLTPLARQQFQRAAAARAISEDVGKALFGQPARTATRTVAGAAKLVGLPSDALERTMRRVEEQTAPTTGPGAVVRAGTEIGAMIPGGFALGAGRAALEASAGESSVNAILEGLGRKPIESPVGRAAAEAGLDVAALGLGQVLRAGARARPRATPPGAPTPEQRALPPGPIQDRSRLLGAGPADPLQGPAIPMGGVTGMPGRPVSTVGDTPLGPAIPTGGPPPPRRLTSGAARPTEGSRLLGPAIPMGGPPAPRRLMSGAPRPTVGPERLGPEPLPPMDPRQGPAIPMRGVETGPRPITDPQRLLPAQVPTDATRAAVQARLGYLFSGQPARLDAMARQRDIDEIDRLMRLSPEQIARLNEETAAARALDFYPDDTPRLRAGEKPAAYTEQNRQSVRRLSDRELAAEFDAINAERSRLLQAQAETELLGFADVEAAMGKTRSPNITPAQRRKRTMDAKRPGAEQLSGAEKRELGYDLTEDARGAIEEMGMDVATWRELVNTAREAGRRLPGLSKRQDEVFAEMEKRQLLDLPQEVPSRPPPADEVRDFMDSIARDRVGAIDPALLVPAGTTAAGAIAGAATTPDDEPGSVVGRAMAGALAGFGAGRLGVRGVQRLGASAADGAAPVAPPMARGVPEVDVRPPERPITTGRVPEARIDAAQQRITEPTRPYPKSARYVPRTDDEWREFYGRFMTNPQEIAEADALRQAGVVQTRQGTRRAADDARMAQTIAETFDDLALREGARKLSGPELVALRAQREANAARRVALSERLADPALAPADREWMTQLNRDLEDTMLAQFERYTRDVSQTGRDLRMLQETARLSENPADWLLRAERLAGGKPLTPEQVQELNVAIQAKDFARASRVVGAAREYGLSDRLGELWQTGLLTSVARPLRDAVGNMVNLGNKQLERVVATGVDRMFGMATGVRTADYSVRQSRQLLNESARRGGDAAMAILRGKGDPAVLERAMKRYDMERESMQRHPWLRAYTTFIKRTIGAADALVYDVALTSALGEQARVVARKTAKEGTPAFDQLVRDYLQAPSPEMFGLAASQAAEVTWQNSTALGEAAQSLRRVQQPGLRLLGKLVVPFVQTPSSMATQTVRGTPLGLLGGPKDVVEMARKTNLPEAQRRLVNRIAKTTVGGGWIALGYTLASDDKMTSWYPDDDRVRRRWELEGRTEAALKVGGTWVSLLGVLGPQAQLMTIGAAMRQMTDDPEWIQRTFLDQAGRGMATTATGAARAVLDSPMLQGVRTVQEIGQQVARGDAEGLGEAGSKAAQTFVGGMVPQVIQQAARASDVTDEGTVRVRQPRVPGDPMQTAINAVLQGIPGARQTVPVRRGGLGEERATSVGGLAGVFSPAKLSKETSDPRAQELWRTGAAISRSTQRRGEPADAYTARQQALGAATAAVVSGVMADPEYQAIAQMPVAELRQALATQLAARGGSELAEMRKVQALSDDEVRRRYQGLVLDMAMQRARTQAGAAFPDPRGGAAGGILQSMTRRQ